MKVRIKVGPVELTTTGIDLTRREIRRLLMDAAGIAATLAAEDEPPERTSIGFTAHLERLPDELPSDDPLEEY